MDQLPPADIQTLQQPSQPPQPQQFPPANQSAEMAHESETNGAANVVSPAEVYANSVDVSIEPNHELELLEMKYDGQEVYKEPLSHSENLSQMISKIDFAALMKDEEDEEDSEPAEEITILKDTKTENDSKQEAVSARKFFQNTYEKVKLAYDEVCVLLDCMTLAYVDKQLMSLEVGHNYSINYEERPFELSDKALGMVLKKKNIDKAKMLLKKSIEKFSSDNELNSTKFHNELMRARQVWRIKKHANRFIGDLSYRTVGCVNSFKATFELIKNDNHSANSQYLSVIIPDEIQDYMFIQVKIINTKSKKKTPVYESHFSLFSNTTSVNSNCSWQEKLERSQNAIYCREIYNQLLREVFDPNNPFSGQLRPVITGNSIKIMITMDHDLVISLVHNSDKIAKPRANQASFNADESILEYYLHDLLKKSFDQNFFHYDQRPITSTFAFNSQIKIAGMAYANLNNDEEDSMIILPNNINNLLNKRKKINLLQSIKDKAEHLIIRKKVIKILNKICKQIKEPHFLVTPSAWNNATSTDITITISSFNYEVLAKSFFYLMIKGSKVCVLNRSANMSISFTNDLESLEKYFLDQCCFHQINLVTTVSELFGWTVMSNSFVTDLNSVRLCGYALIHNNQYSKKLAIKVGPVNHIDVYVYQYNCGEDDQAAMPSIAPAKETVKMEELYEPVDTSAPAATQPKDSAKPAAELASSVMDNVDWLYAKEKFSKADIECFTGLTKIQKFELLLAHFSSPGFVKFKRADD